MKIEFDLDITDWLEFNKHYMRTSKQMRRSRVITTLIGPILFSAFIFIDLIDGRFTFGSLVFWGVISLLWILFFPKLLERTVLKKLKKVLNEGDNSGVLGGNEIEIDEVGIIHKTPETEGKINWGGIKKLEENDEYYFLYNTAVTALIIPKQKINVDIEELDKLIKENIG